MRTSLAYRQGVACTLGWALDASDTGAVEPLLLDLLLPPRFTEPEVEDEELLTPLLSLD